MRFPAALLALLGTCGVAYAQLSTGGGIEGQSPGTPPASATGQSTAQSYHATNTGSNTFFSNGFTVDGSGNLTANNQILNVKSYGALGDGGTNDYTAINNAITAAGAVCGTVFFPQGHYMINSQITIPSCVTLLGVGHPGQFIFAGEFGTILDFVNLPPNTDGMITSAVLSAQAVKIQHMQIERATKDCVHGSFVYSNFDDVVFAFCGSNGLEIEGNVVTSAFMDTVKDSFAYSNGANGIVLNNAVVGVETTIVVITTYALHNALAGIVCNKCLLTTFIGGAADQSQNGPGYSINNSVNVTMIGVDAESNSQDGFYWNNSSGSMTGISGSANNLGGTAFRTNMALLDTSSSVEINYSADFAAGTVLSSINAVNSAVGYIHGGTYVRPLNSSAGGQLIQLDSLGPSCSGALTGSAVVTGGYVQHC